MWSMQCRYQCCVRRNGWSVRSEGFTAPILWQIDNRSMGKLSVNDIGSAAGGTATSTGAANGDMVNTWMAEQYGEYFQSRGTGSTTTTLGYRREVGESVFPRVLKRVTP